MGGSSKRVTVGYDYYMSADMAVSGEVDALHEIIYGERSAWKGNLTASGDIYIDKPSLFGGREREGGVRGLVSALFGRSTQGRHPYLQAVIAADVPAYRGVFRLLFQDFMWSSMNPYFKAVWVRASAIRSGWPNNAVWYSAKAAIGRRDGQPVEYDVSVAWSGENFRAPQTIQYKLQYRVLGSGGPFIDILTSSMADGKFAGVGNSLGGVVYVGIGGGDNGLGLTGLSGVGSYLGYSQGSTPSESKTHRVTLLGDEYEFAVVKITGSRQVAGTFLTPQQTLVGPAYGGAVRVSAVQQLGAPNYKDMNPAHIIYRLLTEPKWQINLPSTMLNDAKWAATADKLHAEGFGLSFRFSTATETRQHIQKVLDHINGYFKHDAVTNTISLELIRGGYSLAGLTVLDNDNSELEEYQYSMTGGDLPNEVIVKWRDDNEEVKMSAPATNLGSVNAQGGVIRTEQDYEGVHRSDLADSLARRDARVLAANLKKMTRKTNRLLWNHVRGDVVLVTDELLNIVSAPYRIVDIDKGSVSTGEITVQLVEDVFGLDLTVFTTPTPGTNFDTEESAAAADIRFMELPYYLVNTAVSEADRAVLPPGYGFAVALAQRNELGAFSASYDLYSSLDALTYTSADSGAGYVPVGILEAALTKTSTEFGVIPSTDFAVENMDETQEIIFVIGEELLAVDEINGDLNTVRVRRGVADSVPLEHPAGTKVFVIIPNAARDATTRLVGDIVYYKPQPIIAGVPVPLNDIAATQFTFSRRAERPYPPGAFQVNGAQWPELVAAGQVVFTWTHRDRITQTVALDDYTAASIGPEVGTTYTVQLYSGATLLRTAAGLAAPTYTYALADIIADGDPASVTVRASSVRGGLSSRYYVEHTFTHEATPPDVTSISSQAINEGTASIFTVTLARVTPRPIVYAYALGGTASAPSDYNATPGLSNAVTAASGFLTVPAGVTVFTFSLATVANGDVGETITLTMGGVTGTTTIAVVPLVTSVSSPSVVEGNPLVFNVVLSAATAAIAQYPIAVTGTATPSNDYNATAVFSNGVTRAGGVLTIPIGVSAFTATFNTNVNGDVGETVILTINSIAGTGTINIA